MRAREPLAKLRSLANAMGCWNACLYLTSRVIGTLTDDRIRFVKYYFMAQPVFAVSGGAPRSSGAFRFDWLGPDSALFSQVERPAAIIAARFAQGARCLAATVDDSKLAGFLWFVLNGYDEDEVRVRFVPGPAGQVAWDFDVTIMQRYRMGRLFAFLWQRASQEMSKHGVRQTLSRISAFNAASLASHRRLGARNVGQASFLCIGDVQLMRSSLSPRWHVSWREAQRPVLRINC